MDTLETYDLKPIRLSVFTPLGNAFFSDFNKESIHTSILNEIETQTGYKLDRQNDGDVQSLMRVVYSDMSVDPYTDVRNQVSRMNKEVVRRATATISTGMLQQLVYLRDISENPVPLEIPVSTSTYGNKIPSNFKFGIF
jgi:Family of unknown function (DUF5761)